MLTTYVYVSGWVDNVTVSFITCYPDAYLVSARVKHSQRLPATPVKPWVAVKQVGTIVPVYAHCTCMAGLMFPYCSSSF